MMQGQGQGQEQAFPTGENSPAYAPNSPQAPQRIGGVPQTIQQGGFQSRFIEAPAGGMRTLVVGGSHPQQQNQSQGRVTRQRGGSSGQGQSQGQAAPPNPSARITIRKIG
jgi:hypothetical protein